MLTAFVVVAGGGAKQNGEFIGEAGDEIAQHPGHQRAFLLGQARDGVEEEVGPDEGQAPASRNASGTTPTVVAGGGNRPFDRHHRQPFKQRELTLGQLRANPVVHMLDDEKAHPGVDSERDKIAGPRIERCEGQCGENGVAS